MKLLCFSLQYYAFPHYIIIVRPEDVCQLQSLQIISALCNSFIPLACAECNDSLPFSGASSIPVMYFFLPPFSTNHSSILSHLILPSISWSTSQSCFSKMHISYPFGNSIAFHSLDMSKPT